jgi:integrase/recombinase XerD
MMREDLYNRKAGFESYVKRIKEDGAISERNKKFIFDFVDDCFSNGLTVARVTKYLLFLIKTVNGLKKDFDRVTREDMKRFFIEVERSDYSEWTKNDMRVIVKRFWKWLKRTEETEDDVKWYPKEVSWLRTTMKNAYKKLPEDILTQEEVRKIIETATNIRDKAMISTVYESGCRIGEILTMRIKSVEFSEPACSIKVYSMKTGAHRRVLLIDSTPYLSNWITHHPNRNDPDSPLWVSIGTMNNRKRLKYSAVRGLLIKLAKQAGVKKRANPHSFRHARATHLANRLTEAQMKEYFGWTQGSKMASVYVHLSGRDVDNAILELHGLKKADDKNDNMHLKHRLCSVCGETNEFELDKCRRCGRPLDIARAIDMFKKEKEVLKMITPEMIENMIETKINEILKRMAVGMPDKRGESQSKIQEVSKAVHSGCQ